MRFNHPRQSRTGFYRIELIFFAHRLPFLPKICDIFSSQLFCPHRSRKWNNGNCRSSKRCKKRDEHCGGGRSHFLRSHDPCPLSCKGCLSNAQKDPGQAGRRHTELICPQRSACPCFGASRFRDLFRPLLKFSPSGTPGSVETGVCPPAGTNSKDGKIKNRTEPHISLSHKSLHSME